MAKMSIGQKAVRVLQFLMGLRNAQVAAALSVHGFKNEDLAEGWSKMAALTAGRLEIPPPRTADESALSALDKWENKWFPIASASLRSRFPEVHAAVFLNLPQTQGPELIISVSIFLSRLEDLKSSETGKQALLLLEKRGMVEAVLDEAKALLKKLETMETRRPAPPAVSPAEEARREAELWNWYLEWSEIARTVISDRRQLRALGFFANSRRGKETIANDDSDVDDTLAIAPVPDMPQIPGMPGGPPFSDDL